MRAGDGGTVAVADRDTDLPVIGLTFVCLRSFFSSFCG
jgi:hypothetical protein